MLKRIVKSQKITIITVQQWVRVREQQSTSTILFHIFALAQHYWLYSQNCPSLKLTLRYWILNDTEIALRISGIAVVSSIAIPETVSLSSLQFQVLHNTSNYGSILYHFPRRARYWLIPPVFTIQPRPNFGNMFSRPTGKTRMIGIGLLLCWIKYDYILNKPHRRMDGQRCYINVTR